MMGERSTITDFIQRVLVLIVLVGVTALLLKLAYLLLLLFGSIVLAVIIRLIAVQMERLRIPHGISTGVAVIVLLGVILGCIWIFGGLVASQFSTLREQLPEALARVQELADDWGIDYNLQSAVDAIGAQASAIFQRAGGFMLTAGSIIADLILVLVGAVFLAADPDFYRRGVLRLLPKKCEQLAARTLDDSGHGLRLWLAGQALASLFVGVLSYVGLTVLGVPSAFALAIIAGVLELIPYVGPILAAVPAIVLGLSVDPVTGLWTLAIYIVIQQLEGNIITPLIQKRAVEMPPLVLLFSIFAAGVLFGAPGVILAAPLTVVAYVMIQHLYIAQVLGRAPILPGGNGKQPESNERGDRSPDPPSGARDTSPRTPAA